MIRSPAVAGQFYSGSVSGLKEQVEGCLEDVKDKVPALGVVCPHAGLMYSGKVAGAVYSRIRMPDTFVMLGPNHFGLGPDYSIMTDGIWRMPFGDVRVDPIVAKEVFRHSRHLEEDMFAQEREHSLEVQLPFMQHFSRDFQIVPLCLRHYEPDDGFLRVCEEIGHDIASALKALKCSCTIVASSDLTHYQSREVANENDMAALDAVAALDAKRLFREVREREISMCGYAPVAAMLTACRDLGARKAELVKYLTSGDVTGDYGQVVGYGGMIVRK
ncbi:MAG: AmmeMemoRadiSam system protein B [Candidatus Altiarchaeota archaeon]